MGPLGGEVCLTGKASPCPQPNVELAQLGARGHVVLGPGELLSAAEVADLLSEARGERPKWGNVFNTVPYSTRPPSHPIPQGHPISRWCEVGLMMRGMIKGWYATDTDARQAAYAVLGGAVPPGGPYQIQGEPQTLLLWWGTFFTHCS